MLHVVDKVRSPTFNVDLIRHVVRRFYELRLSQVNVKMQRIFVSVYMRNLATLRTAVLRTFIEPTLWLKKNSLIIGFNFVSRLQFFF